MERRRHRLAVRAYTVKYLLDDNGIYLQDDSTIRLVSVVPAPPPTTLYFTAVPYTGDTVPFSGHTFINQALLLGLTNPEIALNAYPWHANSYQYLTLEFVTEPLAAQTIPTQDWAVHAGFTSVNAADPGSSGFALETTLLLLNSDGTLNAVLGDTVADFVYGDQPEQFIHTSEVTITGGMRLLLGAALYNGGGDSSSYFFAATGAALISPHTLV